MEWRQLRKDEIDHELVWVAVSGAAVCLAGAWLHSRLPLPTCVFHQLTGLPCPTCGATRCVMDILGGHVAAAFAWNPLVFCALAGMALFNFYALVVLLLRLPRVRISITSCTGARAMRMALVTLMVANWVYLIQAGR